MENIFNVGDMVRVNKECGNFGDNIGKIIFRSSSSSMLVCFKNWNKGHDGNGFPLNIDYPYGSQTNNTNCCWLDSIHFTKIEPKIDDYIEEGNILINNTGIELVVITNHNLIKTYLNGTHKNKSAKWIAVGYSHCRTSDTDLDDVVKILDKNGNTLWTKAPKLKFIHAVHFGNPTIYTWLVPLNINWTLSEGDIVEVENKDSTEYVKVGYVGLAHFTEDEIKQYKHVIKIIKKGNS